MQESSFELIEYLKQKIQCCGVDCQVLSDNDLITEELHRKARLLNLSENSSSLNHIASKSGMWNSCSTSDSG